MVEQIEALASYVPKIIVRRLQQDPTPIAKPRIDRCAAAILFIDISGFTRLTETLVQSGPAGLEELSLVLNAYFSQMIDLILGEGGDVLKFAGDALLAIWPCEEGEADLSELTLRACQCALAMQRYSLSYRPSQEASLALRISVGAGNIAIALLAVSINVGNIWWSAILSARFIKPKPWLTPIRLFSLPRLGLGLHPIVRA
ncbi:MAG: adenylate/guanylate cyclase domain-containing protein [Acaryochloridaceae cyanobacterium SU_2_1]|nr:adenylate/guanylate cyclase domain-containing protein [Acaryochloridaceae cyanobacterium SU_2_1]